jgi:hypothetical protein
MRTRRFFAFAGKVTAAHVMTYLVAGAVAYPLFTKPFYVGPNPVFKVFLRTEVEPELWGHVANWFLPALFLEGLLIAAVLYPFFDTLMTWGFGKRSLSLSALYLVMGFWAAGVAAPGTIEGLVFLRPMFTPLVHLKVQPEMILQGWGLGALVAFWMGPPQEMPAARPPLTPP